MTANSAVPRVRKPAGLGPAGSRLWKDVISQYKLRVDELVLLENACRTVDYIARLDADLVDRPLTAKGSMGQEREHPLLSEARAQRLALARLLGQMDLPESDTLTALARAGGRSAAARTAASARWSHRGAV